MSEISVDLWFSKFYNLLGHRAKSFKTLFQLISSRFNNPNIIETGCMRIENNWCGDGFSTFMFGEYCKIYGGNFTTVDLTPDNLIFAIKHCLDIREHMTFVLSDSVKYLNSIKDTIDVLYLDSWDFQIGGNPNPPQDHCVREFLQAQDKLTDQSIIIIDDCKLEFGGKGGKLIPMLLEQYGYKLLIDDYQVILSRM